MTDLTADTLAEVHRTLDDLLAARMPAPSWRPVPDQILRLDEAIGSGDEHATRAALVPLSRAAFEAKVESRLGATRGRAAVVVPTKRTPALPVVGAVCGAILMFLGWQLGGGLVLAATAALALLVLGVAVAGSRTNAERAAARRARTDVAPEQRVPAPDDVRAAVVLLRSRHPQV